MSMFHGTRRTQDERLEDEGGMEVDEELPSYGDLSTRRVDGRGSGVDVRDYQRGSVGAGISDIRGMTEENNRREQRGGVVLVMDGDVVEDREEPGSSVAARTRKHLIV